MRRLENYLKKKLNKKIRKNGGFTMVELIIVIAIIAILSAVISPQYLKYVEDAREQSDIAIATKIMEAAIMAIAIPSTGVPANVIVEVAWSTDGNHSTDGSLIVRHIVCASDFTKGGLKVPSIEKDHPSLLKMDSLISHFVNAKAGENESNIIDHYHYMIGDAQSALGNADDFIFHINTGTGEIVVSYESLVWANELGVTGVSATVS